MSLTFWMGDIFSFFVQKNKCGAMQTTQIASVICWTGSISYRLSVFWFMLSLHCCTPDLIFYQNHITDFQLAEHLQWFKSSLDTDLNTFTEVIVIQLYISFLHVPNAPADFH